MAKRIAEKELTDRNWDQEDEGEEAGTFSVASDDVMKSRAIKKAKRRNCGAEGEGGKAFSAFKGFSLSPAAGNTGFTGFKPVSSQTNGSTTFARFAAPASNNSHGTPSVFSSSTSPTPAISDVTSNGSFSSSKEYNRQLTALNCSVRDWITKHVNDNPLCDLNPIFHDYERHLASIEQKYGSSASEGAREAAASEKEPTRLPSGGTNATPSVGCAAPLLSLTDQNDSVVKKTASVPPRDVTFKFGEKVDTSVVSALGSIAPSFSSVDGGSAASGSSKATEDDEPSDEPPVQVVKEIKEKDAFYSKKCKLFFKKDEEFKEKGVGTLHLKMVPENKLQLLVRADTNLGNILLNVMVPSSMPCTRAGKNNVMVVCVPNPPLDKSSASPVPFLIRVKTSEDADQLHRLLLEKRT